MRTQLYAPLDDRMSFEWDAWGCGVVMFAIMFGVLPFERKDLRERNELSVTLPKRVSNGFPSHFSLHNLSFFSFYDLENIFKSSLFSYLDLSRRHRGSLTPSPNRSDEAEFHRGNLKM